MALHEETLVWVIRNWPKAEEAAKMILEIENAQRKVAERKREAESIMSLARAQVAQMMREELCSHQVRKTHADPSGNNDSCEQCLICGETLTNKTPRFT